MDLAASLFTGISLLTAAFYLFFCHALSVIARKTNQGDTAEILAYVPGLQVLPMIWAGGGHVFRALAMGVALALADGLLWIAADKVDGPLSMLFLFISTSSLGIACILYFAAIGWQTAIARGLPGFIGLLTLPASALAYPIIAFHDGWARPHRTGAAIGVALCLAFVVPLAFLGEEIEQKIAEASAKGAQELAEGALGPIPADAATEGSEPVALPETVAVAQRESIAERETLTSASLAATTAPVVRNHERSIRALFALQERFDRLDAISRPKAIASEQDRARTLALIGELRSELTRLRGQLDDATHTELRQHLVSAEARIQGRILSDVPAASGRVRIAQTKSGATHASQAPPAARASSPDLAPTRPFPVRISEDCPPQTELRSRTSDEGEEEWCQRLASQGGLRHGWYARLFEDGRPEQVGEYRDGMRVGVWTRFHRGGGIRAQAQFEEGMQHGWLLSFDRNGKRQKAVRFESGNRVR